MQWLSRVIKALASNNNVHWMPVMTWLCLLDVVLTIARRAAGRAVYSSMGYWVPPSLGSLLCMLFVVALMMLYVIILFEVPFARMYVDFEFEWRTLPSTWAPAVQVLHAAQRCRLHVHISCRALYAMYCTKVEKSLTLTSRIDRVTTHYLPVFLASRTVLSEALPPA